MGKLREVSLTILFLVALTAGFVMSVEANKSAVVKPSPTLGSVIRLVNKDATYCSGVVIDNTTIVTAAHCVIVQDPFLGFMTVNKAPIEIRSANNTPIEVFGKVGRTGQQLDRAIIKGDFSKFKKSPYVTDPKDIAKVMTEGNKFISCGYPLGGKLYCSQFIYVQPYGFGLAGRGLLIPGMSGGPTMLPDGTVIAINSGVTEELSIVSPIYGVEEQK